MSFSELQTALVQIECKLNNRLITYISDDGRDIQALTPSMLLNGRNVFDFKYHDTADEAPDPIYAHRNVLTRRFDNLHEHVEHCCHLTS